MCMVTCGCMCKVCLADVCVCVPFIIAEALHSVTPQVRLVTCGHMCKVKMWAHVYGHVWLHVLGVSR